MFIRSSTAVSDCLIAVDVIRSIEKADYKRITVVLKDSDVVYSWIYETIDARDKAFEQLCAFLNSNYKLRDFT